MLNGKINDTTSYFGLVEFLSIDLTRFGDQVYRFVNTPADVPGENPDDKLVTWGGYTWKPLPFESSGWKRGGDKPERPKLNLPDYQGLMYVTLKNNRYGVGAPVNRYQVMDPTLGLAAPYTVESYQLASFSATGLEVSLELATAMDLTNAQFLGFKMTRKFYPGLGSNLLR